MENPLNFVILLNRENAIYSSGEEVSGKVRLVITERMKINGIYLQFKGDAHVRWTERRTTGQGKNRRTMTYTRWDHETIFDFKLLFLEKDPNISELYIEPNEYNYPFKFILPAGNIPTSYQHYEAYVRYCNIFASKNSVNIFLGQIKYLVKKVLEILFLSYLDSYLLLTQINRTYKYN